MVRRKPARFSSLKLELMIMVTMLTLFMSASMGITVGWIYSQALAESQVRTGSAFARGAAFSLAQQEDWSGFPWVSLEKSAEQFGLHLSLAADSKGRIFRRRAELGIHRDEAALRAALAEGRENISFDGSRFSVALPVISYGRTIGALCFSGYPGGLKEAQKTSRFWMAGALFANLIFMALFLFLVINRRLVTPMRVLARELEALGQNCFEPQARNGNSREIDALFTAFDQTAQELLRSRRQMEEQVKTITETRAQLVSSEKMATVGRLASGLAHELGNPIGALMGFIHLLRGNNLNPEDRAAILAQSTHELERMDGSIKELLNFSRPSDRKPEPVDMAEVAVTALNLAKPQKWADAVDFVLEIEPNSPPASGERNALLQVLLNLLANAGQALQGFRPDPKVGIEIHHPEPRLIRIRVTDNGPGVAPADVPHLFEPYFTRKERGQGTGLGLAISLSIVDGFGGRLEYAPNNGGGAAFIIYLNVHNGD